MDQGKPFNLMYNLVGIFVFEVKKRKYLIFSRKPWGMTHAFNDVFSIRLNVMDLVVKVEGIPHM